MQIGRLFPAVVVSLVATAACTPAAKNQQADQDMATLQQEVEALKADFAKYKDWLGKGDGKEKQPAKTVHEWHKFVEEAICNLETKVQPPVAKRLCHPDTDHGSAPHPPPWF